MASGSWIRTTLLASALAGVCACGAAPQPRVAAPPVVVQRPPMQIGEAPLIYELTEETEDTRYVGGTAYVLVDALPDQVMALLDDTDCYWQVLPRVWDVKVVGRQGRDKLVELEQGSQLVRGRYTARVTTEHAPGHKHIITFTLDKERPHSLKDAHGSVEMEPYGPAQTLVTWRVKFDLGPGIVRWLFEERIRKASLKTPVMLRTYVESRVERAKAMAEPPAAQPAAQP
jgi:carbon monoxide dehydrogenase subunit G